MKSIARLTLCALFAFGLPAANAQEVDTLQKIRSSKAATMGVRDSAAPLSYATGSAQYAGYHVDLCRKVLQELVPGVQISYIAVTSVNRVPLVKNGTVDMECGSTTNNDARQKDVAFAVTTFIAQIRMAVKKASGLQSIAQLDGKTVVTTAGGTGLPMLRKQARAHNINYDILMGADHAAAFLLLEAGRADAFVLDDNVLAGLIAQSSKPQDFAIVGEPMSADPIAIMLRKDDPAFKAAVDSVIKRMMRDGELAALYDKWFTQPIPPRGISVGLPMSGALKKAFSEPNDRSAEMLAQ